MFTDNTAVTVLPTPSPESIRGTHFSSARRFAEGYDKAEVEQFQERMAGIVQQLIDELADRESRINALADLAAGVHPHADYEFGEQAESSMDNAQLESERIVADTLIWRQQVIEETEIHRDRLLSDVPPRIDPNNIGGSLIERGKWLKVQNQQFGGMCNELMQTITTVYKELGMDKMMLEAKEVPKKSS